MVKHTPKIRWQPADQLFESVWSFCGVGAKEVKKLITNTFACFPEVFCKKACSWKLVASKPAIILKTGSSKGVFLWNLRNSQEHLLWRTFKNNWFFFGFYKIFRNLFSGHVCWTLNEIKNIIANHIKVNIKLRLYLQPLPAIFRKKSHPQ